MYSRIPNIETYEVKLHRPNGVTVKELVEYIKEALDMWGGQRHPDDPLFYAWGKHGYTKAPAVRVRRRMEK